MERIKYQDLIDFLEGNILKGWTENRIRQLEKESKDFEIKEWILYRKGSKRLQRVLREDEIDSVIFIMHNHPTGGHFEKDATYSSVTPGLARFT